MAKRRTKKATPKSTTRKKGTKGSKRTQSQPVQRGSAARGQSDDFVPDEELSQRFKSNIGGRDLPAGVFGGTITGCQMGKRFNSSALIFKVKISAAEIEETIDNEVQVVDKTATFKGRDTELVYRLKTDVDFQMLGDCLEILGYEREELEADQLPGIAKEMDGEPTEIRFASKKSTGKDGRIFTNYRLLWPEK